MWIFATLIIAAVVIIFLQKRGDKDLDEEECAREANEEYEENLRKAEQEARERAQELIQRHASSASYGYVECNNIQIRKKRLERLKSMADMLENG